MLITIRSRTQTILLYVAVARPKTSFHRLGTRLFLLLAEQRVKRHTGNLDDLETDARNITDGVTLTTEASDENFIVFVGEVQATIARDEGGNLLTVLDELNADALTDGRVRLLGFNANLLENDTLGVRATGERLLPLRTEVRLVEILVGPALFTAVNAQLTASP
jgi:hypothetical protein